MPNPFYPVYGAGAGAAACEPVYLPTTIDNGFLPDLDAIDEATLARTVAFYLASPANPQGSVAKPDYFKRLKSLADRISGASGEHRQSKQPGADDAEGEDRECEVAGDRA